MDAVNILARHVAKHFDPITDDTPHCQECCGKFCGKCLVCLTEQVRAGKVVTDVCACGEGILCLPPFLLTTKRES